MYFSIAGKLGMTVETFLSTVDSRELSEWMALENLEFWRKRIHEKHQTAVDRSKQLLGLIAGTAMAKGAVHYGERTSE